VGADISAAIAEAYRAVERIAWTGMQYRRDIGRRALDRDT
jgi:phosphoribosylamine-glycine ligase